MLNFQLIAFLKVRRYISIYIDDRRSQVVQFCLRNDTEAEAKAEAVVAFDRAVTLEDKAILENTDYDTPLDLS